MRTWPGGDRLKQGFAMDMAGRGTRQWRNLGVVVLTMAALAVPAALLVESSSVTPIQTLAAPVAMPIPPLPEPAADASSNLDGAIDHLPYVAQGFSDDASALAASELAALDPRDATAAQNTFYDAWNAMTTTDSSLAPSFAQALTSQDVDLMDPSQPSQADNAFSIFTGDPENAPRVANAAVALFVLGMAQYDGAAVTDGTVADPEVVEKNAYKLLARAYTDFSSDGEVVRPILLDMACLTPLLHGTYVYNVDALKSLRAWADGHPGDTTAHYLLAHLLAQGYAVDTPGAAAALSSALTALRPIGGTPKLDALRFTAAGDAELGVAREDEPVAPYHARQLALSALDDYDSAARLTRDPGPLAGRAAALDFLGHPAESRDAQLRALRARSSESAPGLLALASLDEQLNAYGDMRQEARHAERLVASNEWKPRLDSSRLVPWDDTWHQSGGDSGAVDPMVGLGDGRGYTGESYGSLDDPFPVLQLETGRGGGGAIFSATLVSRTNDPDFDNRRVKGIVADAAAATAIQASALLGDTAGADADLQAWRESMQQPLVGGNPTTATWTGRHELVSAYDDAAHLISTPVPVQFDASTDRPASLLLADTILRRVQRFRTDIAVCHASEAADSSAVYAARCEAEAKYLAGEYSTAQQLLSQVYATNQDSRYLGIPEDLVAADLEVGRPDLARRVLLDNKDALGVTDEKLGELSLDDNRFSDAMSHFTASLAASQYVPGITVQIAHSNRGIAGLRALQGGVDRLPDCAHNRPQCAAARADFQAALQQDPDNSVYLLNLAWVQRLLGDGDAAQDTLRRALDLDPTLFPALNDLGVLEAEHGHVAAARRDFSQALAIRPGYDLALWNLGVLEMGSVSSVVRGETDMARATRLDRSLRGEAPDLRTDERVYKVVLTAGAPQPFGRTYGAAAATLGSLSLAGLLGAGLVDLLKERGREGASEALERRGRGAGRWLERRLGRGLRAVRARPWLVTAPVLLCLTALVTTWAGQAPTLTAVLLAAYAGLLGLLVHETGHVLAAWLVRRRVRPAQSMLVLGIAVALLPLRLLGGPCVGHEVVGAGGRRGTARGERRRRIAIYAAGPLANLLVAVAAGVAYVIQPLPFLRLVTLVQFGMVAFSFLPVHPMEGAILRRNHARLLTCILVGIVIVAVLLSEGVL